jgi:hypothetical protein
MLRTNTDVITTLRCLCTAGSHLWEVCAETDLCGLRVPLQTAAAAALIREPDHDAFRYRCPLQYAGPNMKLCSSWMFNGASCIDDRTCDE